MLHSEGEMKRKRDPERKEVAGTHVATAGASGAKVAPASLTIEQAIVMNVVEQRLHMRREVITAELLGAVMPKCGLCNIKLSDEGRVWQEGDECPSTTPATL